MTLTVKIEEKSNQKLHIEDTQVIIKHIVIDDREVADYLSAAEDSEGAIIEAIRLGVRILSIAERSGDVEMVKREFDAMISNTTTKVDKVITEAKTGIEKRLAEFTSDELQKSLRDHRSELNDELVKLFGPDSANSVQKQIDKMLEAQGTSFVEALTEVLEQTDDPENAFFKLRKELEEKADETLQEVKRVRDKLLEVIGEAKGAASEREKGTAKGRSYQEYVFEQVEGMARLFGDTAEDVSDELGEKGKSKAGDIVVEINPSDTNNTAVKVVFEAKNRKTSVPAILKELEEAKENRVAEAAVAVFASQDYVPSGLRTWRDYSGHRYICVLHEDELDPFALEFSYRCARVDALHSIELAEPQLDFATIKGALKQMGAKLKDFQQMRTKLTGANTAIDGVKSLIKEHEESMRSDLEEIDRLLSVS